MDIDSEEEVEYLFDAGSFGDSLASEPEGSGGADRTNISGHATRQPMAHADPLPRQQRADSQRHTNARPAVPAPHHIIDIDAYHHGPFRGALARAVEHSRRQERTTDASNPITPHTNRTRDPSSARSVDAPVSSCAMSQ